MTDIPQKIFFVGGAPRSGTTVTHALLCSSKKTNPYHPEISYITPIFKAYMTGLNNWDGHTFAFFKEKEHFRLHMAKLLSESFAHISNVFGNPEILCVKDPLLTPYFPRVVDIFRRRARLVTVIRHPYAVVRSRQEVARKAGRGFGPEAAAAVCREYNLSYQHLDNPALKEVLMHFRYEDILNEDVLKSLRDFTGCPDISPDNVWGEKKPEPEKLDSTSAKDPWFSPKYHKPINIDNRLGDLDMAMKKLTDNHCGVLMERFGYAREAKGSGA
jgi:hypothetical protein